MPSSATARIPDACFAAAFAACDAVVMAELTRRFATTLLPMSAMEFLLWLLPMPGGSGASVWIGGGRDGGGIAAGGAARQFEEVNVPARRACRAAAALHNRYVFPSGRSAITAAASSHRSHLES